MRRKTIALRRKNTVCNKNSTQLYVFKLHHGIYKIGCSDDVSKRLKQGKTWSPNIELVYNKKIPAQKSKNWRFYECKIHKEFCNDRCENGGTELFRFAPRKLDQVVGYIKNMRF